LAKKAGLSVSLEFVTWTNLPNIQAALGVLHTLNHANLGLLIDVLHFNRSRVNLEELTVRRGSGSTSHISATSRNITEALI
jgi:hypothetical protein